MYVYFFRDGKQYRTTFEDKLVERLDDGGVWTRILSGRWLRIAAMEREEWLNKAKREGR
jgi:hypothetical protein